MFYSEVYSIFNRLSRTFHRFLYILRERFRFTVNIFCTICYEFVLSFTLGDNSRNTTETDGNKLEIQAIIQTTKILSTYSVNLLLLTARQHGYKVDRLLDWLDKVDLNLRSSNSRQRKSENYGLTYSFVRIERSLAESYSSIGIFQISCSFSQHLLNDLKSTPTTNSCFVQS